MARRAPRGPARPGPGRVRGGDGTRVVPPERGPRQGDDDDAGQATGDDGDPGRAGQGRGQPGLKPSGGLPGWLTFLIRDSAPRGGLMAWPSRAAAPRRPG
jgi:hypothetical protein